MSKTEVTSPWITVKILREQHDRIEKVVKKQPEQFLTVPEFIRVAISNMLKETKA
jgi:hypothetical protein